MTKTQINCSDCGITFRKMMEEMESLPTECPSCGGNSFELTPLEDEEEEYIEEEEHPIRHNYDITHIEEMEEAKRW